MAFSSYSLRAHKKVLQTKNQTIFKNLTSITQLSPDLIILRESVVDVGDECENKWIRVTANDPFYKMHLSL